MFIMVLTVNVHYGFANEPNAYIKRFFIASVHLESPRLYLCEMDFQEYEMSLGGFKKRSFSFKSVIFISTRGTGNTINLFHVSYRSWISNNSVHTHYIQITLI